MNIKMLVVWLLLFALLPICGYCQSDSRKEFSNVICDYYLPINKNGLSITSFNVTSKIRIERWEKNAQIILDIEKYQGTASNPDPKFKYSYNYMGKQYGDQHVGKDPFESISTENLTYEVMVSYGDKIFGWKKVDGKTNFFGPIEKDAKASGVMVNVRIVGLMFRGTNEIETKIRGLLQGNTTSNSASSNPLNNNSIQANNSNESAQSRNAQQQNQQQNGTANLNNTRSNGGRSNNTGSTKINQTNSTITNQSNKSNTEEKQVTGTPNNTTSKPLDNYDANTRLYTNPMANSSNVSTYNKDIQRAVIVLDIANGILDLLGPSPEKKARKQKEELDRVNAKANLELVALNKIKEKERLENEIKEAEKRKEENEKRKYEFIKNFGKSEMPMSSTKAINNEVYFFCYFKEIDSNAPLNVSNVFPWGKYADGTWPNKDKLNSEHQKLFHSYYPTISGYYTIRKEAEIKLQEFVERAKQYGISLKTVTFKGIEATTTKTDFWGNPVKSN